MTDTATGEATAPTRRRKPGKRRRPPKPELARWLGIYHPAYNKFIFALAFLGTLVAGLNFLDNQILFDLQRALIAAIGGATIEGSETSWSQRAGEAIGISSPLAVALMLLAIYCIVLIAIAVIMFGQERISGTLNITSRGDIEREILRNLMRKDDQFFQSHSAAEVANRLAIDINQVLERRRSLTQLWFALMGVIGSMVWFVQMNVALAVVLFGTIVAGVGFSNWLGRKTPQFQRQQLQADDKVKSRIEDFLNAVPEVQVSHLHDLVIGQLGELQRERRRSFMQFITLNGKLSVTYGLSYMAAFIAFVVTILVLGSSAGSAPALILIVPVAIKELPKLYGSTSQIARFAMMILIAGQSVQRLMEYAAPAIAAPKDGDTPDTPADPPAVSLKGVTYRFSPESALQGGERGISAELPARSFTALVGGSGSGKSTLSQIILNRIQAEGGAVTLDGEDVRAIGAPRRAATVAYMPQSNVLLDATIADNVLFGHAAADDGIDALTDTDRTVLERTGVAALALSKALEMTPDADADDVGAGIDIGALRSDIQGTVNERLGLDIISFGQGRAGAGHPMIYHLLGGTVGIDKVLDLTRSKAGDSKLAALAKHDGAKSLVELGARVLASTQELLGRCRDVGAYNRVAPVPLDEEVWKLRSMLAGLPPLDKLPDPARRKLLAIGLLASPAELDGGTFGAAQPALPASPDPAFIAALSAIAGDSLTLFDAARINPHLTWRDNLLFGAPAAISRRQQGEIDRAVIEAISGLPIEKALTSYGYAYQVGRHGRRLSGGQRQMVCLGRTLLRRAGLYILDEPTAALDPHSRARINAYLKDLSADATIIAITHDPELARAADSVLMMAQGRLVADGRYDELIAENPEFQRMIGAGGG